MLNLSNITISNLDALLKLEPFSLPKEEKKLLFEKIQHELILHHYQNCAPYQKIIKILNFIPYKKQPLTYLPFLPVRLFKTQLLKSVDHLQIIKTLTSSGTSGQTTSKIMLDQITATLQTKVLTKIMTNFISVKRLPMLIIDSKSVLKDRLLFSARGAGILGFSMLGRDITYALDENMQLDLDSIATFCDKYKHEDVLVFGFTYIIWTHFYKYLAKLPHSLSLKKGIMIHGGGWKKLLLESVDNRTFKALIESVCHIKKIYNYYGMIEQTGSIFVECEQEHLHCSLFSDVLIRRPDFSLCDQNEVGIIELISLVPFSYPGHILLSEDLGEILGEDNCQCGKLGKYFKIHGRIKEAEIRGCGDTYAES